MEIREITTAIVQEITKRDARIYELELVLSRMGTVNQENSQKPGNANRDFLTEQEIVKWVGERCGVQEAGCPVCKAWARHDLINHLRFEDANTRAEMEFEFGEEV